MQRPLPGRHGGDQHRQLLRRSDADRVQVGPVPPVPVLQLHPHAMQVDRVAHHRLVDHHEPESFPYGHVDRSDLGELLAVETPDHALHVAAEPEHDLAGRLAVVDAGVDRAQVRVGEHAALQLVQAVTGDAGAVAQHLRLHLDLDAGLVELDAGRRLRHGLVAREATLVGDDLVGVLAEDAPDARAVGMGRADLVAAHHALHAHVGHGPQRPRVEGRDLRLHPRPGRERSAGVSGAAEVLREDGVGPRLARAHDHVVGLGHADAELVDRHRDDVVAVDVDHAHRQAGDAHVVVGRRRGVDDAQPDPLAGPEQGRPVRPGRLPVHQVGVGLAGRCLQAGRVHARLGLVPALLDRVGEPAALGVGKNVLTVRLPKL